MIPNDMSRKVLYMPNTKLLNALSAIDKKISEKDIKNYSSLGIWSLAAYLGNAHGDAEPSPLLDVLGMSVSEANATMKHLIEEKPAVVSLALSSWAGKMNGYVQNIFTATGDFALNNEHAPIQDEMDNWTKVSTLGIFEAFPMDVEPFDSIFTSVVATKIKWAEQFDIEPVKESRWNVQNLLIDKEAEKSVTFFKDAENRYVAFRKADEDDSLSVIAILPLDSDSNLADVSNRYATNPHAFERFGIALAMDSPYVNQVGVSNKHETYVRIPAWEADSNFSVSSIFPEFDEVGKALLPDGSSETLQFVKAKYNALGFEAAAVTTMMLRGVSIPNKIIMQVSFDRDFHVVAVGRFEGAEIPMFSFEVTAAVEATDEEGS